MLLAEFQKTYNSKFTGCHTGFWKKFISNAWIEIWMAGNQKVTGYHIRLNKNLDTQQSFVDKEEFVKVVKKYFPQFELPETMPVFYFHDVILTNN